MREQLFRDTSMQRIYAYETYAACTATESLVSQCRLLDKFHSPTALLHTDIFSQSQATSDFHCQCHQMHTYSELLLQSKTATLRVTMDLPWTWKWRTMSSWSAKHIHSILLTQVPDFINVRWSQITILCPLWLCVLSAFHTSLPGLLHSSQHFAAQDTDWRLPNWTM